jgi:molecular chaperone DnaJ
MNGSIKKANIFRRVKCNPCNGTGANNAEMNTCSRVEDLVSSRRWLIPTLARSQWTRSAMGVKEKEEVPKSPCTTCRGEGTQRIQDQVEVRIPKGSVSGMSFVVPGMGDFPKGSWCSRGSCCYNCRNTQRLLQERQSKSSLS